MATRAVLLAVPVGCAVGIRLLAGPLTVDDAYITFRYARNIAEGAGFVYNPGQPVLGTSTPLYALLLAGLAAAGLDDLPRVAWVLNALLDATSAALLYLAVGRLAGWWAGALASTLFALAPMSIAYSAGGMETSLFVVLLVGSFWATVVNRPIAAVGSLALATLVRPEAVIPAALLLIGLGLRARRFPTRAAFVYGGILAPWVAYAIWQFGSPLPQSMTAKAAVYRVEPLGTVVALSLHAVLPAQSVFLLGGEPLFPPEAFAVAGAFLAPFLAVLGYAGGRQLVAHRGLLTVWALFPFLYVSAYAAAGFRGVRLFHWYLIPLTPFYLVLLTVGISAIASAASARFGVPGRTVGLPAAVLFALWWAPGLLGPHSIGYPVGFSVERERLYREVAIQYRDVWGPGVVIAAPEIGAIGYYVRGEILDTLGLITPAAAAYHPLPPEQLASDNGVPAPLIRDLRPDYVVSLDQFIRLSLLPDPWFQSHYELIEMRDAGIFGSRHLLVFRRQAA